MMLWTRRTSWAVVLSSVMSLPVSAVAGMAQVVGDQKDVPAAAPMDEPEPVFEFSVLKLKDADARWILTIAVASDVTTIKPGDLVDFLELAPPDAAQGPPDKRDAAGRHEAQGPGTEEILRILGSGNGPFAQATRDDVTIHVERVLDRVAEPRNYPMVGAARLYSQHYKCSVHSRKTTRSDWPIPFQHVEQASEVVYVDRGRLVSGDAGTVVAEEVQVVGVTRDNAGRPGVDRLIVAVTPKQINRLKKAKSSGTVFVQRHRP
jgi:hypothetical protein